MLSKQGSSILIIGIQQSDPKYRNIRKHYIRIGMPFGVKRHGKQQGDQPLIASTNSDQLTDKSIGHSMTVCRVCVAAEARDR